MESNLTLIYLEEDIAALYSSTETLRRATPDQLSPELKKAFTSLARACKDYLEVYAETSREP